MIYICTIETNETNGLWQFVYICILKVLNYTQLMPMFQALPQFCLISMYSQNKIKCVHDSLRKKKETVLWS